MPAGLPGRRDVQERRGRRPGRSEHLHRLPHLHGGSPLGAALGLGPDQRAFEEISVEEWNHTIATNLSAIFYACRAALPHMLAGDGGSIINTASTLGLIGSEGFAAYGAAKAGLVLLTKQLAVEYGPTVRANVIAPGSIDTPRFRKVLDATPGSEVWVERLKGNIPVNRLGLAEDNLLRLHT